MFAVPGWAVPVESLVSTNPLEVPSTASAADTHLPDRKTKAKKRRRDVHGPLPQSRVTSEDLHRLWSKEFRDRSSVKEEVSKARKRGRQQKQGSAIRSHENGGNADDADLLESKETFDKQFEQELVEKPRKKSRDALTLRHNVAEAAKQLEPNNAAGLLGHPDVEERHATMLLSKETQEPAREVLKLPPLTSTTLTPLQAKMRNKLTSARFRHLNEKLYTSPSSTSLGLFTASPDLFAEYHAGFTQQVKDAWPENPVDGYIRDIRARAKANFKTDKQHSGADCVPLPRRKTGSCTIADLGCGDAPLARAFQLDAKALNLKFHNFDLHTPNSLVTKADIADLPLRDGEADIAVFCLSLMGTNWVCFIEEAWRVLRGDGKGELWVAEVKSRFGRIRRGVAVNNSVGKKRKPQQLKTKHGKSAGSTDGDTEVFSEDESANTQDETDVSAFSNVVVRRGFVLQPGSINKHNKMFVKMAFNKVGVPSAGRYKGSKWNGHTYEKMEGSYSGRKKFIDEGEDDGYLSPDQEAKTLKPCIYKKR